VRIIGKGDKERIVVFPPHVGELIVNWTGGLPPEAFLLESPQHFAYPRSPRWIVQTLKAIGRRAGLPYALTTHLLRHGFARLCKTRGMPLEVTARLMGHEDVSTTAALYGRLDADDLQQVYDRVIGEEGTPCEGTP
jgi:integrase